VRHHQSASEWTHMRVMHSPKEKKAAVATAPAPGSRRTAKLILHDGTVYNGWAFGAAVSVAGEVSNSHPTFLHTLCHPQLAHAAAALSQRARFYVAYGSMCMKRLYRKGLERKRGSVCGWGVQ
jgi:hypothetical protein